MDRMYFVGIKEIDSQHAEIFSAIESLQQFNSASDRSHCRCETLEKLRNLLGQHFDYEESFMERISCADLQDHKQCHVELLALLDRCIATEPSVNAEGDLGRNLGEKISGHLLQYDFMMEQAVKKLIDQLQQHEAEEKLIEQTKAEGLRKQKAPHDETKRG
ncbi:MAG: hypothetical protein HXX19_16780 [Rhodoferax sp.]|nr:hypothetical protein [Rhodoferax sp.]